jgi:hypothetical protein
MDLTGNKMQQLSSFRDLAKFNRLIGFHDWMNDLEHDEERKHWIELYDPCPFYVRYQRYESGNKDSTFFLNDFNLTHSHLLELKIAYPFAKQKNINLSRLNFQVHAH